MPGLERGAAQTILPLLQFTNAWRYEASGFDLGNAWRSESFNDEVWPIGPGLFYYAETTIYPAPFLTQLPPILDRNTAYFRTRFHMPAEQMVPGLKLFVTNLVDDGCVIHLNGQVAGRVRMPTNIVVYGTFTTGITPMEGQYDVVSLDLAHLRAGENLLAVEVHQATTANTDVVFGQKIVAHVPHLLAITNQPASTTNLTGETVTLSVGVEGTPVFYQWMKGPVRLNGFTNATLSFVADTNDSGEYSVIVTNGRAWLVSEPARVAVVPDRTGPSISSAVVQLLGMTNFIDLTFSERMSSGSPSSFQVIRMTDSSVVTVSTVQHSAQFIRLTVTGPNWQLFDPYVITVNNVKDVRGNSIAPNTQVAVSWQDVRPVITEEEIWLFHSVGFFDPFVYAQDWTSRHYVPGEWWSQGQGMFFALSKPQSTCVGAFNTDTSFQPDPTLFRKSFGWPDERPLTANLKLRYIVDDGAVFYLNGSEIHRVNASGSPVSIETRATSQTPVPQCVTNVTLSVSNLVHGVNVVAVAVVQATTGIVDMVFGLGVDAIYPVTPLLPPAPPPTLAISHEPDARIRLSWTGGGYALEVSSDLSLSSSYPFGPWTELPNMTNPYLLSSTTNEAARFFRLKKK